MIQFQPHCIRYRNTFMLRRLGILEFSEASPSVISARLKVLSLPAAAPILAES